MKFRCFHSLKQYRSNGHLTVKTISCDTAFLLYCILLYFFGVFFCSVFVQPDADGANLIFVSTMHLPDQNINPGVIGRHLLESETYCIYNHVLITEWCLFLIELEFVFFFFFQLLTS